MSVPRPLTVGDLIDHLVRGDRDLPVVIGISSGRSDLDYLEGPACSITIEHTCGGAGWGVPYIFIEASAPPLDFTLPDGWTCVGVPGVRGFGGRYQRADGALVRYDTQTPHSNPMRPSARMWTAWEPDPGQRALSMGRRKSKCYWPRRFHSAHSAMRAADRAWPIPVAALTKILPEDAST